MWFICRKESGDERYRYRPCPVSNISHGDELGCDHLG